MTPDSLEAALRAVLLVSEKTWPNGQVEEVPDYPALAAAAREWIKQNMPMPFEIRPAFGWEESRSAGYNRALADVAKALGLEEA